MNFDIIFLQADTKQKSEVLALIAKVLGFNEEERIKTGLDGPGTCSCITVITRRTFAVLF